MLRSKTILVLLYTFNDVSYFVLFVTFFYCLCGVVVCIVDILESLPTSRTHTAVQHY